MKLKSAHGGKIFLACLLPGLISLSAHAATVNGTLSVQAIIGQGCQVNAANAPGGVVNYGTLNFGSIYQLNNTHIDAQTSGINQGSITVECSTGTSYNIALDNGQHYQGGTRSMQGDSTPAVLLNYSLFQDSARATPWVGGTPVSFIATATPTEHHVYGRIPAGQTGITAASYSDTVQVVVNW